MRFHGKKERGRDQNSKSKAIQTPPKIVPAPLQETAQKSSKVSFTWARLIARIYQVDPLLCSCGKEMKITKIVTNSTQIWRILTKINWPTTTSDFDEAQDLVELGYMPADSRVSR